MNAASTPDSLPALLAWAAGHEMPWTRDPEAEPARFGIHHEEAPPWNRLLGPVHPRGPVSVVVWQHGDELVASGEPERADQTFSVAKTYLVLLAGVAQRQGLLPDVDRPVAERLPGIGFDSAHNRPITWRQLFEQTSEWEGESFGLPDTVERWRAVALNPKPPAGPKGGARPLQAPGSYWEYNDVRINQLSLALLHLFREPLEAVFQRELLQPLGANDPFRWEGYDGATVMLDGRTLPSVPGGTHWGGGVSISARDQARIGQLLLDKGRVEGKPLLPRGWVAQMAMPSTIAPFYGWLVWLNTGAPAFAGASHDSVFMIGAGGHLVWVDPGLHAVVVARWLDPAQQAAFIGRMAALLRPSA